MKGLVADNPIQFNLFRIPQIQYKVAKNIWMGDSQIKIKNNYISTKYIVKSQEGENSHGSTY